MICTDFGVFSGIKSKVREDNENEQIIHDDCYLLRTNESIDGVRHATQSTTVNRCETPSVHRKRSRDSKH